MHTKELARALRAFAELAEFDRSQELYGFSDFIEHDGKGTVVSRLKQATPSSSYPLRLRESLQAIALGFKSVGAIKQANAISQILKLFAGRPGATLEGFIAEISVPPKTLDLHAPRFKSADLTAAKLISSELSELSPDRGSFEAIMAKLRSPDVVKTATLALIANLYIGNGRIYRDRKMALDAIDRHFHAQVSRVQGACEATG
jgi:hypothetical protein